MYEDIEGKRLLVLGGTRISCEIIRKAKAMGLIVGVADYNSIENSPGKQIADEIYDASATNVDEIVNVIKENHFDGVLTGFSDMLLPYYAQVCEKTGLPSYGTLEQFAAFTNKREFKQLCEIYGVPTIKSYDINCINYINIDYPVLVKPSDNSGSRGVYISKNPDELKRDIERAMSFSKSKDIIVEKYMTGREVTVNWLFIDGEYYLTGIANRHVKFFEENTIIPLPVGYTYPASITMEYRRIIEYNFKKLLKALGVKNGTMFMQCKVENDICYVYDVGYRLTGALEYKNFAATCGYDPLEMLIHFSITGKMCDKSTKEKIQPELMKPSFNVSFIAEPGTIKEIVGIEKVLEFPEVVDVVVAHEPGETITRDMKGLLSQITVRAFGQVENKTDLYPTMKKIENTIQIISNFGDEMRKRGIEEKDIEGLIL